MYCSHCGHENESSASVCISCGKPISGTGQKAVRTTPPASRDIEVPGRGGLILTFGILSLILLGPILGIPAWVMGSRDMRKIRDGRIAPSSQGLTKTGMVLGIIGTFISTFTIVVMGVALAVAFSMFKTNAQVANRDQVMKDLNSLAVKAQQYLGTPSDMGGGAGAFVGFRLFGVDASDANGIYQIVEKTPSVASFYKPSASQPARNPNFVEIVGWGEERGRDGVHNVEACVTVTPREIYFTVIN